MSNDKEYELININGKLKANKDGVLEIIGSAIDVKSVVVNIDTDEVRVKFEFMNKGRKISKSLRRDNVTKSGSSYLLQFLLEIFLLQIV